ncbi:phosphonate utilization transcriptional regulator PhnR [Mesorhizobium tianshanense]|uniref:GntR family transcriptional regulator n=1 Tax=Mesorhizobium tianshanense TaxID=39844 RepID=A0A562NLT9_9HYPH|nr:GntR family transcriptional regulator [Mesorhizobium tianshanense]TWI33172.1 GntR family transcriptional regulator [Mesorhizobium tianshanense]GLS34955.1 phosphonate utilization transcriptional regulator PhnR [Mesorhizobium tianshanense]
MTTKGNAIPIIKIICDDIAEQIRSGATAPGTKLPSERELGDNRRISRMTARRIYERLESEGLVSRSHRRGWFVAEARLQFALMKSVSFINSAAVRGRDARALLLGAEKIIPPEFAREQLKLRRNEEALFVRRVLQLGDRPAAIETMYLTHVRFPNFLDHPLTGSILSLWQDVYGITVGHADATLRGTFLSDEDADLLSVSKGSPTIVLTQTMVDHTGEPFAYDRQDWRFELAEFLISADFEQANN